MELKTKHLILLSVIGGVIMGISFPFTGGLFFLSFIGFVPLIVTNIALNNVRKLRFLKRFYLNYIYFVIFNLITTWWIYYASEGGMYMAVLCNSLLMILPFFFFGFITRFLGENKGLLSLVALWAAFEYGHYYWELSWPWLSFGHVFGTHPWMIQWYEYSGVTGGTLWILLVNIAIYLIIRNRFLKKESWKIQTPIFLFVGLALLIPILSSLLIYVTYEEKEDPVDIVIVQPNLDAYTEKFSWPFRDQLDLILDLSNSAITAETDIILCPETAFSERIEEARIESDAYILEIKDFLAANNNIGMLIGADSYGLFDHENSLAARKIPRQNLWFESYNAAFFINPKNKTQIYHKAKPVLGAEKVPFLSWFPSLKQYSVELGGTSAMIGLGEEPLNFTHNETSYAPLICYESVYGDYVSYFTARGAEILCVITNDGWWDDTPGYKQHRSFSQIRAIENRRAVARSANTGISCGIDQKGNIVQELGWDIEGAFQVRLNKNQEITFFVRYGDVIGRISLFLAIAMMIYAITIYAKTTGLASKVLKK